MPMTLDRSTPTVRHTQWGNLGDARESQASPIQNDQISDLFWNGHCYGWVGDNMAGLIGSRRVGHRDVRSFGVVGVWLRGAGREKKTLKEEKQKKK